MNSLFTNEVLGAIIHLNLIWRQAAAAGAARGMGWNSPRVGHCEASPGRMSQIHGSLTVFPPKPEQRCSSLGKGRGQCVPRLWLRGVFVVFPPGLMGRRRETIYTLSSRLNKKSGASGSQDRPDAPDFVRCFRSSPLCGEESAPAPRTAHRLLWR